MINTVQPMVLKDLVAEVKVAVLAVVLTMVTSPTSLVIFLAEVVVNVKIQLLPDEEKIYNTN